MNQIGIGQELYHILSHKEAAILERWFQLIAETYPEQSSQFLKQAKDRFSNPVGYIISREIKALYEELLHGMDACNLAASLENILKLRSVQDFLPSQAVSFIFLLKRAVREQLAGKMREGRVLEELSQFETRIDELALLVFDMYMKCREKIQELRINEIKAERERVVRIFERTNLAYSVLEKEQQSKKENRELE